MKVRFGLVLPALLILGYPAPSAAQHQSGGHSSGNSSGASGAVSMPSSGAVAMPQPHTNGSGGSSGHTSQSSGNSGTKPSGNSGAKSNGNSSVKIQKNQNPKTQVRATQDANDKKKHKQKKRPSQCDPDIYGSWCYQPPRQLNHAQIPEPLKPPSRRIPCVLCNDGLFFPGHDPQVCATHGGVKNFGLCKL